MKLMARIWRSPDLQRYRPPRWQLDNQQAFPDVAVTIENGFVAGENCFVANLPDETHPKTVVFSTARNRDRNYRQADQKRTFTMDIWESTRLMVSRREQRRMTTKGNTAATARAV
jgi:hypothetical protein